MSALWGEIPSLVDTESSVLTLEQEQLSKPRCVEVDGPALYQPSIRHFPPVNEPLPSEYFELDSITHHTIQLVQYARRLKTLIHGVRQQIHDMKVEGGDQLPTFPSTPVLPLYIGPPLKYQEHKPIPFLYKDLNSKFLRGLGTPPPEIDAKTSRKLLRKSVAAILAHTGYDSCSDSILETMTDISHDYMLQITKLLRTAVDEEAIKSNPGFPDVMERVFHEIGIGSTHELHNFYQIRVINYNQHMIEQCKQLQKEYENMRNPDYKFEDIRSARGSKDEPCSDSSIQFPLLETMDGEESGDTDSLQLEGLGLDISVSQENSTEEESRWPHIVNKPDQSDTRVRSLDGFDDTQSTGTDVPNTPAMSSEAGESIQDPGSVSAPIPPPEIISPPNSIGMRTPTSKPPKKNNKMDDNSS